MADNGQDIIAGISSKVRVILERQTALEGALQQLRSERDALQAEVASLKAELQRLKVDNEYLAVMKTVAPTSEDVAAARSKLNGLIREIDRCIAELKAC